MNLGIAMGFGNGTVAAPSSTPTSLASILLIRLYGYDPSNTITEGARIGTFVDQTTAPAIVPQGVYLANADSSAGGGVIRRRWAFDSVGHQQSYISSGLSVAVTECGSSPSVVGTDSVGQITVGSSASAGCTLTFAESYSAVTPICTPICNVNAENGTGIAYTATATQILITTATLSGVKVDYRCGCYTAAVP